MGGAVEQCVAAVGCRLEVDQVPTCRCKPARSKRYPPWNPHNQSSQMLRLHFLPSTHLQIVQPFRTLGAWDKDKAAETERRQVMELAAKEFARGQASGEWWWRGVG